MTHQHAPEWRDRLVCGDSRHMAAVPDESVCLVVTSPPYNCQIPYLEHDDNMPLPDYLAMLEQVWRECYRILRPGGKLCINTANLGRRPRAPLGEYVARAVESSSIDWQRQGEVLWVKGASVGTSTAWGSWCSPSSPILRDVHETIQVWAKGPGRLERVSPDSRATITADEFTAWTQSVWYFPTESASKLGHPAPFPLELPRRLIRLYTWSDSLVVDCFAGSGSSCVAAKQEGRGYVGYELSGAYVDIAQARLDRVEANRPIMQAIAKAKQLPLKWMDTG